MQMRDDLGITTKLENGKAYLEFALPENEEVLMLLDLGYAAEGAKPLATHSQRKPLAETVQYR